MFLRHGNIGTEDDRDRPKCNYAVFDPHSMYIGLVRLEIPTKHFKCKSIRFQMLQVVGQFSGTPQEDPHVRLKQFFEM